VAYLGDEEYVCPALPCPYLSVFILTRHRIKAFRDMRPLIYRELNPSLLVLWLHDCTTEEDGLGLPYMFEGLLHEMVRSGCRYIWVGLNKQDDPRVDSKIIQNARIMYEEALGKYNGKITWKVLTHKLSGKTGEGTIEVLEEFYEIARKVALVHPSEVVHEVDKEKESREKQEPRPDADLSSEQLHTRLEEHIQRDTLSADTFWTAFVAGELMEWNHYSYLRAIYFLILDSKNKGGVYAIGKEVSEALTRFKELSPQLSFDMPPRFSITISTFWTLQLQRTIQLYRKYTMAEFLPSRDDFPHVLRHTPHLMNRHLWVAHYRNDPDKRTPSRPDYFHEPDLRRLHMETEYLADPATLPVPSTGPDRLLRYAFGVMRFLRKMGTGSGTGTHRGQGIEDALVALQQAVMRSRTFDESLPAYSETQAYFWILVVDAALRAIDGLEETEKEKLVGGDAMSFSTFQVLFQITPALWKEYYSKKVWEGITARARFVMPDRKPLPDVFPCDAKRARELLSIDSSTDQELPLPSSIEERLFRFRLLKREIADLDSALISNPAITTHGHLLMYLYTAFTQEPSPEEEGAKNKKKNTLAERAKMLFSSITGPMITGATARNFWIQQVGVAMSHSVRSRDQGQGHSTFAEFITRNAHLVLDDGLPAVYYGPGTWGSAEARRRIVAPDRRRMEMIVDLEVELEDEQEEGEESEEWVHVKTG
jgi:ubiquitin carboxyl-terminal hydrolase L3